MGYRLSKITTKTGDKGSTGLGNGERVSKGHQRVVCMGDVDELNSLFGVVLSHDLPDDIIKSLQLIQHQLFDLGAELAVPSYFVLTEKHITWLEQRASFWLESLKPLEDFILPGGSAASASIHLARAVCRRAERQCVLLADDENEEVNPYLLQYLNRLSDVLFILARYVNLQQDIKDVIWHKTEWDDNNNPILIAK